MTVLREICSYGNENITVEQARSLPIYISTESMGPNRGSVSPSTLPANGKVKHFYAGDTLISNIRPYFKKIWHAETDGACSNDILIFEPKNCSGDFLYWSLSNDCFFDYMTKTAKGTKMPRGDKYSIMEYEMRMPSMDDQASICAIMSSIQNKIELNNQINDYLEELASTLFKKSFGGLSRTAILSDLATITMGQSPVGSSYNESGIGTVFYQGRGEFGWRFPTQRLFTTEPKRIAQTNDILMSVRAPVGDLNIAYESCCIGRGLAAISSKYSSYCFYLMRSLRKELDAYNGDGTVFGSINRKTLNELSIPLPQSKDLDAFEMAASPIDRRIRENETENRRLCELRDTLLPKLMSGEINISTVDVMQLNNHLSDC